MIELKNVGLQIKEKWLLKNASITINTNELVVIMGANGAGKSTLLKLMSGLLKPSIGEIYFDNQKLSSYKPIELARMRAVLSQHYEIAFPLKVSEIAMMGRYPYFIDKPSSLDESIVLESMQKMEVAHLCDRNYATLSGGEAQKVQMSRVLAQIHIGENEKKMMLLDEPVSHLDMKFQYQLLEVAKNYVQSNTAVLAILHDINLALKFADRILFMKEGSIVAEHVCINQLTENIINEVFGVEAHLLSIPGTNRQWVAF
jgi:iron complex transport system ATP-binding protein